MCDPEPGDILFLLPGGRCFYHWKFSEQKIARSQSCGGCPEPMGALRGAAPGARPASLGSSCSDLGASRWQVLLLGHVAAETLVWSVKCCRAAASALGSPFVWDAGARAWGLRCLLVLVLAGPEGHLSFRFSVPAPCSQPVESSVRITQLFPLEAAPVR